MYRNPEPGPYLGGAPVLISQTGFSGEKGYEVYVYTAHETAEQVWYALRGVGARQQHVEGHV